MSHEPSRPRPAPSAELLRLAEEGAHNLQRADQDQQAVADRHLRVALGAHYGSDRKRGLYLPIVAGGGLIAAAIAGALPNEYVGPGAILLMIGVFRLGFLQPSASDARVEAERAWLAARPFPLRGYFEALQRQPVAGALLLAQVRFVGEAPPLELVRGVFGRIDASATVQAVDDRTLVLQTGLISGATGIRINKVPVHRNHRLVPYVHRLVDEVLAPLHATYPIEQVELTRPV